MRQKNAVRQHLVAEWESDDKIPEDDAFVPLARRIETIEDDSDEDTDDYADYAGDGSNQTTLNGRTEKWNFEGTYDPTDPAQKLIADKRRKVTDDERKLWHKIIETDGTTVLGIATAMEIKAGGGDASEYETFEGHLDFIKTPEVVTPAASK